MPPLWDQHECFPPDSQIMEWNEANEYPPEDDEDMYVGGVSW